MVRFVVLVVLVVLAVWLVRRALRGPGPKAPPPAQPGELVRCAHCGLLLPRLEAREKQGTLYCSDEHARLGAR